MYELEQVSARIAYNWRDKYLSGVTNLIGIGSLPIYTRAYPTLPQSQWLNDRQVALSATLRL
jgi:iron complex outermembrane recepter protein